MKKHYKGKDYGYGKFLTEYPVSMNRKIDPHKNKNFDHIGITYKETATQEFLTVYLWRNKPNEQIQQEKTG